ncbi:hypothetical protein EVAR_44471_1 [Eumeta japonica]|uniref:Uncharacterized protein n=1 Tax=Eumeta variegata TaxID=151549 RepID=A0A4C1WJ67_EUMVA|nr:hypothetical protein EVAR_44471_1 [Eumeta japonica]
MSDFHGLMKEPEGSDDEARLLAPELTYYNGTIYPNRIWACWNCPEIYFDHDGLSGSDDGSSKLPAPLSDPESRSCQSVFHDNIHKSKHDYA